MKAIINARVHTMAKDIYESGYILIEGKKIKGVGNMSDMPEFHGEIYDAKGAWAVPGLIDAHCHIGVWEDSLDAEGNDGNEETIAIGAHLRAIDAINPMDVCFKEAMVAGVTTVVTGPGSASPIGGQFVAMKTHGIRVDDMIIKQPVAMKFAFGENPKKANDNKYPQTRMGTAALIREALFKAQSPNDIVSRSLAPVLGGGLLVKAHAHRADDIATAIRIAKEFGLDMTIEHATEGHLLADILKEENISVCVGPSLSARTKPELKNLSFTTAGTLSKKGIPTAIITDHPEIPVKYLTLCAAIAVKEGMDEEAALSAITITAAKNCKIDNVIGSIECGKDADIAIFNQNPLKFEAKCIFVMINGEEVHKIDFND